jgi:hypothetical protein
MGEPLDAAIAAHGGQERWRAVRSIDVTFNFFGEFLELKGCAGMPVLVGNGIAVFRRANEHDPRSIG